MTLDHFQLNGLEEAAMSEGMIQPLEETKKWLAREAGKDRTE